MSDERLFLEKLDRWKAQDRKLVAGTDARASLEASESRGPIMPVTLPQSVKTLLLDKAYEHVVTSNGDGKPQVTMVWMDVDGDEVIFNTAEGRRKAQNLRRDPRIIVSVQHRSDPQVSLAVGGNRLLGHLPGETNDREEQRAGNDSRPLRPTSDCGRRIGQGRHG
jgi:hypothetical protein